MTDDQVAARDDGAGYHLPNKMGRIVLLSLDEVMGRIGVNAILNQAHLQHRIDNYPANNFDKEFSFQELGQLLLALDEMYGPRGGRGLARRAGQACFRHGVRDFGPMLGIADLAFRVLPQGVKLKVGFQVLAETLNKFTDHLVHLDEDDQYFHWVTERCGVCWGRTSESPCCHLAVGLLEEGLYWVSGGRTFYVEEVSCVAMGDPSCTILVGRRPLE